MTTHPRSLGRPMYPEAQSYNEGEAIPMQSAEIQRQSKQIGRSIDRSNQAMSGYENIVGGKLKLKGKALDVKAGSIKKKKKKHQKKHIDSSDQVIDNELSTGQSVEEPIDDVNEKDIKNDDGEKTSEEGKTASYIDHLTPAERRYIEQRERIDVHRMAKEADKSHRDRIQDFNQYLANMSEHYDIPKVGPG
ncbi:unnamed protein product [Dovyalis caffra]|uniref:Protein FAM32A-like n=1 Tax=Dovyalis caffra TaxID=77055 RepID=A0AAV1QPV6_9ROSI|nr:unnamed protein product [Dovyalis caffra]